MLLVCQSCCFCFISNKTALDPDDAEFVLVQYFNLKPSLDNVDALLFCKLLWRATDDKFNESF